VAHFYAAPWPDVCEFATEIEAGQFIELCQPDQRAVDAAVDDQDRSWARHLVDSSIHRLDAAERKQLRDQLFDMDMSEINSQIEPGAAA
jgi:streptogramin lyase